MSDDSFERKARGWWNAQPSVLMSEADTVTPLAALLREVHNEAVAGCAEIFGKDPIALHDALARAIRTHTEWIGKP